MNYIVYRLKQIYNFKYPNSELWFYQFLLWVYTINELVSYFKVLLSGPLLSTCQHQVQLQEPWLTILRKLGWSAAWPSRHKCISVSGKLEDGDSCGQEHVGLVKLSGESTSVLIIQLVSILTRPRWSQRLLFKHRCHLFIKTLIVSSSFSAAFTAPPSPNCRRYRNQS